MARFATQDFLRGSGENQSRTLIGAGLAAVTVIVLAIVTTAVVYPKATAPSGTELHLVLPSLGPGVTTKSTVLLRGAEVGVVTDVDSTDPYAVHLDVTLDDDAARSLTDALKVDFRPANYFGITAVNLIAEPGGAPLRNGQTIHRDEAPDFTMSTMIEHGSIVIDGSLTQEVVSSLNRVTRYATGLAPLVQTMVIVSDTVAQTQKQLPSTLLNKMNDIMAVFPEANVEALGALGAITNSVFNTMPDGSRGVDYDYHKLMDQSLTVAADDLFGAIGTLLGSHGDELTPMITSVKNIVDPVPGLMGDASTMRKLQRAIDEFAGNFHGPEGQQTLHLRLVFDMLPGLASPLRGAGVSTGAGRGAPQKNGEQKSGSQTTTPSQPTKKKEN